MKAIHLAAFLGLIIAIGTGCGSAENKNLDDARFALDDANYTAAIAAAGAAAATDPGNLNAFNLLSSGYAGLSGINLLNLAQVLTNSSNSDVLFNALHTEMVTELTHTGTDFTVGFTNLNTAITTLAIGSTTYTGAPATYAGTTTSGNSVLNNQYFFQVGILMYLQAVGLPTVTAQPTASGAIDTSLITAADATTVQNDFINGYAALANTATGIATDNSLLTTMSTNYCVLKNASGAGITQACLQDFTVCQLDSAYVGPFSGCVAACATFNFSACDGTVAPAL